MKHWTEWSDTASNRVMFHSEDFRNMVKKIAPGSTDSFMATYATELMQYIPLRYRQHLIIAMKKKFPELTHLPLP